MAFWLIITILSYLFFSFSFFGDKLVLNAARKSAATVSGVPSPKLYTFYVGLLSILAVFLIPFVGLTIPTPMTIVWVFLSAATAVLGLYSMFGAVEKFEVSRVLPTIGALQPIFILVATWLFLGTLQLDIKGFIALGLLVAGSLLISIETKPKVARSYFALTLFSSLMFALNYLFSKFVFLEQPFLQGFILMSLAIFALTLVFLLDRNVRAHVFSGQGRINKNAALLFFTTQACGGIANVLQSFAIYLVPVSYLAVVNSLRGIQYVFLFLITLFFSSFFPRILKEETSKKVLFQKVVSILIIVAGLAILILS